MLPRRQKGFPIALALYTHPWAMGNLCRERAKKAWQSAALGIYYRNWHADWAASKGVESPPKRVK